MKQKKQPANIFNRSAKVAILEQQLEQNIRNKNMLVDGIKKAMNELRVGSQKSNIAYNILAKTLLKQDK